MRCHSKGWAGRRGGGVMRGEQECGSSVRERATNVSSFDG